MIAFIVFSVFCQRNNEDLVVFNTNMILGYCGCEKRFDGNFCGLVAKLVDMFRPTKQLKIFQQCVEP